MNFDLEPKPIRPDRFSLAPALEADAAPTALQEPADVGWAQSAAPLDDAGLSTVRSMFGLEHGDATSAALAGFAGAGHEVPHRAEMEASFGVDFSGVTAHTDGAAAAATDALGAHAYAMGSEVAFGTATPDKGTVAHELTHVLQQTNRPACKSTGGGGDTTGEREAEAAEAAVIAGQPARGALGTAALTTGGAVSSAPALKADPNAERDAEIDFDHYVVLVADIINMLASTDAPAPPPADPNLLPAHSDMLLNLRTALDLRKSTPEIANSLWTTTSAAIETALGRASAAQKLLLGPLGDDGDRAAANSFGTDLTVCRTSLATADKEFLGAAYHSAVDTEKSDIHVETPDIAEAASKLESTKKEMMNAKEMFENIRETALAVSGDVVPKGVSEAMETTNDIYELVTSPRSIAEIVEEARAKGLASTALGVLDLALKAEKTMVECYAKVGSAFAAARKAAALAKPAATGAAAIKAATEELESIEKMASKFESIAELAENLSDAATVVNVIADEWDMIQAIRRGDYGDAVASAASAVVDGAPILIGGELGSAISGPLAAAVVVFKAEVDVLKNVSQILAFCKRETVRQAVQDFVNICDTMLNNYGYDFLANCELMTDPARTALQATARQSALTDGNKIVVALHALATTLQSHDEQSVGGHPDVVTALGDEAMSAIDLPLLTTEGDDDEKDAGILLLAQQLGPIFHGANTMATYVGQHYAEAEAEGDSDSD